MRNWNKNFLVLMGFLFLSLSTLAQTTITSGSTVNSVTIPVGNTIVIEQGGTLRMNVSRSFASITTSTTGAGTAVIDGGGDLTITGVIDVIASSGLSATLTGSISTAALVVDGTYENGSTGALTATTMNVNGGGTYIHAINGGTIPTATWASSSTFQLTGLTGTIPAGMGQTFGNFVWNAAGQSAALELLAPLVVAGDLSIINSNNNSILVTNSATARSVSVTGNFIQSGGQFAVVSGAGVGTLTVAGDFSLSGGTFILKEDAGTAALNIGGNFSQSGGVFDQRAANTLSTGITTISGNFSLSTGTFDISGVGAQGRLNVSGDFFQTGGTITQTGGGGSGLINLSGDFSQTAGTITETSTGSISIVFNGASEQTYISGGTILNTINFTVNSGSYLQMATSGTTVGGASVGTFTLSNNATLGVTSLDGITTTGATGNVRVTGTRTYSAGANYIYNGTSNQNVGNGLIQNTPGNVTINNPGNSVALVSATTIGGTLTITDGTFNANGNTATVTGPVNVNGGFYSASTATQTFNGGLNISGGTFTGSTGSVSATDVNISSGTLTAPSGSFSVSGNWDRTGGTFSPGTNTITFTDAGTQTLNSGGSSFYNVSHSGSGTLQLSTSPLVTSGTFNNSAGTFDANGQSHLVTGQATVAGGNYQASTSTQTFNGGLLVSSGSFTGSSGNLVINGILLVGNSGSFSAADSDLSISGTTVVGSGTGGTFNITSSTGTKIFTGLVTIATGAIWNNSGDSPLTFRGGITNSGTFTAGNGIYTFDTNSQSLTGVFSIPNVTIDGVSLSNNNSLTVGSALSGTGNISQAVNSTLVLSGTSAITSINTINTGNTVIYNGTAQTIISAQYQNLTINQAGGTDATLGGNLTVNDLLTLSAGKLNTGANVLTMASSALGIAGAGVSRFIVGNLEWSLPAGGSTRIFEIGTTVYVPVTLVSTGVTGPVNVLGYVTLGNHPNENTPTANASGIDQANKVNHYWTLSKSGAGTFTANATFDFTNTTNTGTPATYVLKRYESSPNFWTSVAGSVGGSSITSTGGLTAFGDFQVGNPNSVPTVSNPSPVTVCQGGSATFTVIPTGVPPVTYQWRKGGVDISGANAGSLVINPVSLSDVGNYDCVVSNVNGSATSNTASLTVHPSPTLAGVVQAASVCEGSPATMTLTGLLASATFTIDYSINALAQTPVTGIIANTSGIATFSTPTLTAANNGQAIEITGLTVTSTTPNCTQSFSQSTLLSVNALPEDKTVSALSPSVCNGSGTSIQVLLSSVGVNYQLRNNTDNSLIGATVAGTGGTINLPTGNLTSSTTYNVLAANSTFGCSAQMSATPVVTVNPTPVVVITNPAAVCSPSTVDLTAAGVTTGSTGGLTYTYWTDAGATVSLATPSAVSTSGTYYIKGTTGSGCFDIKAVAVIVNPTPSVIDPADQTVCNGAVTTAVNFSGTGTSYDWTNDTPSIGLAASGSGNITSFIATNLTGIPVVATIIVTPVYTSGSTCTGNVQTFTITVNPTPIVAATSDQEICNGSVTSAINFTGVATSYTWTNNNTSIGLAANGSGNIGSFAGVNSGATPQVATITVTPVYGSCIGAPDVFTITVNHTPIVADPVNQVVCNGGAVSAVNFSGTGTSYTWTNDTPSIGLAASGSGDIGSFSALNLTSSPVVATITVTPVYTSVATCTGSVQTFTITVNPTATVNDPSDQIVCNGGSVSAIMFSGSGATSYAWSNDTPGIGLPSSGSGDIASFTAINMGSTPVVSTITVTPYYGTCAGTPESFTITVNQTPVVTDPLDQTVCDGSITTAVAFSGTGTNYTWANNNTSIGLAGSGTGNIASFTAVNTGVVPVVATITVTPVYTSGATCTGSGQTFTITVNPTPIVTDPVDLVVCNGSSVNAINFSGSGTSYTWINDTPSIGLLSSGTGDIGSFIANNLTNIPIVATITVTPVYTNGVVCSGSVQTFTITVNPTATVTDPTDQVVCNGLNTTTINFIGSGATSFVWSNDNTSIGLPASGSGDIGIFTALNIGSTPVISTITVTPYNGSCAGAAQTFTITVNPTPVVTDPVDQIVCNGGTVSAINFSGTGTSYTWTNDTPSIGLLASGSGDIASFIANNVTSSPVVATITVTPLYTNGITCTGSVQTFTITVNPTAIVNDPADEVVCNGGTVNAINFSGSGATSFIWSNNTPGIGFPSSGSGNIASFTAINTGNSPVVATLTVTPFNGSCVGVAQTFTITVNPSPTFTITNAASSICTSDPVNITLNTPTAGGVITLTSVNYNGASGTLTTPVNYTNGQQITELLTNGTSAPVIVIYTFSVAANGCSNPVSQQTSVVVNPTPTMSFTNATTEICSGSPVNITLNSPTTGAIVTLTNINYGGVIGTLSSPSTYVPGSIISETLINNSNSPITVTYSFTVAGNGCSNSTIFTTDVVVNPNPSLVVTNTTSTICSGSTPTISFVSPADNAQIALQSVVYGLVGNGAYTSGATFALTGSLTEGNLVNNTNSPIVVTYTFSVTTPTNPVCPLNVTTQTTSVTVLPAPTFTVTNSNPQICAGAQTNITLNTTVAGAQVRLNSVNYGTAVGSLTAGALYADGQTITEILTNSTNAIATVTYEFESIIAGCAPSASQQITVDVKPTPVVISTPLQLQQSICSGTTLNFLPTSTTGSGTTYSWTSSTTGSFTGVTTNGAGAITDSPVNTTNTVGFVTYTITPEINGCSGVPVNYVVTVSPTPSANGSDITICSGQNALIAINAGPANVAGTTFSWIAVPSSNVTGAINDNGSTINQVLTLINSSVGTVTYQVTPTANGCAGPVKNIVVTINPLPTVDAGFDYQVCEPSSIPVTGIIGGAATSGTWVIVSGAGSISSSAVSGTQVTATYTIAPADIASAIVLRLETNDPDLTGPCALVSDLLQIQINRRPTVILPADFSVCEPSNLLANPINLSGIIGGSASNALWSIVSGSGTLSASTLAGSNVISQYTIDPLDIGNVITLRLTTNDPDGPSGPCTTEFEEINITINRAAVVSAGPDLQLCEDVSSIVLQGSQSGASTSVAWTGGVGSYSNATVIQPTYSFSNPGEINTTLTLTVTALDPDGAGPCTSVSDQMNLTINPLPVVVFTGLPPGAPSQMVENNAPITLTGNQVGGAFTITPSTSVIGSTFVNVVDRVTFDPSAVELGSNLITYTFTNVNGCTNSDAQEVFVNPVTTVDFGVQGAVVNALGEFELCANLGLVKLLGFPVPAEGFAPETQFTSVGPNAAGMVIVQSGTDYFIQTDGIGSNSYRIRYTFKNQFGAITFREKSIRIFASPVSQFTSSNNCIISDVIFTDNSTINPTPFTTAITSWQWNFGDNDFSSLQNPSKRYNSSGTYNVTLRVSTSQGCSTISAPFVVRVGDVPEVDYSWSSICNNDQTKFIDETDPGAISVIDSYSWDFGDGFILTGNATDAVPGGTHGGSTTGTFKSPDHQYTAFGTYNAKLTVLTNDGCSSTLTQRVFILPYNTVAPVAGAEYFEEFELTNGGWIAEPFNATNSTPFNIILSDTSWVWGPPTGATINSAAGGSKVWWTGGNANTYYSNENSVINGPCFDLTQLKRPMVALDYFSDTEANLDGAVLQYSTNGGITWTIVGPPAGQLTRDEGINWFNGAGIFSNPGSQPIGNYGWTDKQTKWENARFNLDMIPSAGRGQVRLRIAFSSNDGNAPAPPTFDGFAFDNFFVGEKKRNVLVEHFTTSTLNASLSADSYLNTLLQDQITLDRQTSDFSNIQYHVNFSGVDLLNRDNPADPAARALYYGVSQPPFTIMDGLLIPDEFTGVTNELTKVEIDRRALSDPQFELTLDTIPTSNSRTISVRLTLKALKAVNVPLVVHVALLEDDVTVSGFANPFKNVLRKQLFGSDGETITLPFLQGQSLIKPKLDVEINSSILDPSKLILIGIVQDKNSKEIYQSIVTKAPKKNGAPIVGVKDNDPIVIANLNSIQIFPNPANGMFNFGIPGEIHSESQWKIVDQRGVTVSEGNFSKSTNGLLQVDVTTLSNAMYYVVISSPGGASVRKKLMVMNRN